MNTLKVSAFWRPDWEQAVFKLITPHEEHHFASHKVGDLPELQGLFALEPRLRQLFVRAHHASGQSVDDEFELTEKTVQQLLEFVGAKENWALGFIKK